MQKAPAVTGAFQNLIGRRPTLPPTCAGSTIGAEELNFRVRDGNGCDLLATVTQTWLAAGSARRRGGRILTGLEHKRNVRLLCDQSKFYGQAERAISNGKLHITALHIRPIHLVVYQGPC
jgi:hypothetical protein